MLVDEVILPCPVLPQVHTNTQEEPEDAANESEWNVGLNPVQDHVAICWIGELSTVIVPTISLFGRMTGY